MIIAQDGYRIYLWCIARGYELASYRLQVTRDKVTSVVPYIATGGLDNIGKPMRAHWLVR